MKSKSAETVHISNSNCHTHHATAILIVQNLWLVLVPAAKILLFVVALTLVIVWSILAAALRMPPPRRSVTRYWF